MTYSDLIDAIEPIAMKADDAELLRYIALAEQEIYRACGLRPKGRPRLTLIRGGLYPVLPKFSLPDTRLT